jgi:hypothetical protein
MKWFRCRHPELTFRSSQGLDIARARGLCPENVATFYHNLRTMYEEHQYPPSHLWNCDKTGAQAGRNGGGRVFAKSGSRNVHSIIPNEREWLSVLCCINVEEEAIPNFYIFKGKRMRRNILELANPGDTMAMQPHAWMTAFLFDVWISHFIQALGTCGGISAKNWHCSLLTATTRTLLYRWFAKPQLMVWTSSLCLHTHRTVCSPWMSLSSGPSSVPSISSGMHGFYVTGAEERQKRICAIGFAKL